MTIAEPSNCPRRGWNSSWMLSHQGWLSCLHSHGHWCASHEVRSQLWHIFVAKWTEVWEVDLRYDGTIRRPSCLEFGLKKLSLLDEPVAGKSRTCDRHIPLLLPHRAERQNPRQNPIRRCRESPGMGAKKWRQRIETFFFGAFLYPYNKEPFSAYLISTGWCYLPKVKQSLLNSFPSTVSPALMSS